MTPQQLLDAVFVWAALCYLAAVLYSVWGIVRIPNMHIDLELRPLKYWRIVFSRKPAVAYKRLFIQLGPFCLWLYWSHNDNWKIEI